MVLLFNNFCNFNFIAHRVLQIHFHGVFVEKQLDAMARQQSCLALSQQRLASIKDDLLRSQEKFADADINNQ
jgi:hypothetical protein